jgi:hypothetical protein
MWFYRIALLPECIIAGERRWRVAATTQFVIAVLWRALCAKHSFGIDADGSSSASAFHAPKFYIRFNRYWLTRYRFVGQTGGRLLDAAGER